VIGVAANKGVEDGGVVDGAFSLEGASVLETSNEVKMFVAGFWILRGCIWELSKASLESNNWVRKEEEGSVRFEANLIAILIVSAIILSCSFEMLQRLVWPG
jgi:hypothetical protein